MPNETKGEPTKQKTRDAARKAEAQADEALREQTKTETEEHPYLDTEGGD